VSQAGYGIEQGSPNYGRRAKSGSRNYFIRPQIHFVHNEKIIYIRKCIDLVECNISRNNRITWDVRPSNCCEIDYVAIWKNVWRPCSALTLHKVLDKQQEKEWQYSHVIVFHNKGQELVSLQQYNPLRTFHRLTKETPATLTKCFWKRASNGRQATNWK